MPKYLIYRTDDDGRSIGNPLGTVRRERLKDWIFDIRGAVSTFVKTNPKYAKNKNWLTAEPISREDIIDKINRLKDDLKLWRGFLNPKED